MPHLPTGNGGEWWGAVSGYETGQTPALGAVACFAEAGSFGHVAIVEQITEWGFRSSNSGYPNSFFFTDEHRKDNGYLGTWMTNGRWSFQGFIYNPYACQSVTPQPPEDSGGSKLWMYCGRVF